MTNKATRRKLIIQATFIVTSGSEKGRKTLGIVTCLVPVPMTYEPLVIREVGVSFYVPIKELFQARLELTGVLGVDLTTSSVTAQAKGLLTHPEFDENGNVSKEYIPIDKFQLLVDNLEELGCSTFRLSGTDYSKAAGIMAALHTLNGTKPGPSKKLAESRNLVSENSTVCDDDLDEKPSSKKEKTRKVKSDKVTKLSADEDAIDPQDDEADLTDPEPEPKKEKAKADKKTEKVKKEEKESAPFDTEDDLEDDEEPVVGDEVMLAEEVEGMDYEAVYTLIQVGATKKKAKVEDSKKNTFVVQFSNLVKPEDEVEESEEEEEESSGPIYDEEDSDLEESLEEDDISDDDADDMDDLD